MNDPLPVDEAEAQAALAKCLLILEQHGKLAEMHAFLSSLLHTWERAVSDDFDGMSLTRWLHDAGFAPPDAASFDEWVESSRSQRRSLIDVTLRLRGYFAHGEGGVPKSMPIQARRYIDERLVTLLQGEISGRWFEARSDGIEPLDCLRYLNHLADKSMQELEEMSMAGKKRKRSGNPGKSIQVDVFLGGNPENIIPSEKGKPPTIQQWVTAIRIDMLKAAQKADPMLTARDMQSPSTIEEIIGARWERVKPHYDNMARCWKTKWRRKSKGP